MLFGFMVLYIVAIRHSGLRRNDRHIVFVTELQSESLEGHASAWPYADVGRAEARPSKKTVLCGHTTFKMRRHAA